MSLAKIDEKEAQTRVQRQELRSVRLPSKIDKLKTSVLPAVNVLPPNSLPGWKHYPLEKKFPKVPAPEHEFIVGRNAIGEKIFVSGKEYPFDNEDPRIAATPRGYESLHDPHLKGYFMKHPKVFQKLVEEGLVEQDGSVNTGMKEFNTYRAYLGRLRNSLVNTDIGFQDKMMKAQREQMRKIVRADQKALNNEKDKAKNARLEAFKREKERREIAAQLKEVQFIERGREKEKEAALMAIKREMLRDKVRARLAKLRRAERRRARRIILEWYCRQLYADMMRKARMEHKKKIREKDLESFIDAKRDFQEKKLKWLKNLEAKREAEKECAIKHRNHVYEKIEGGRVEKMRRKAAIEEMKARREVYLCKKFGRRWLAAVRQQREYAKNYHDSVWRVRQQLVDMVQQLKNESGKVNFTSFIKGLISMKPGRASLPEMSKETKEIMNYIIDLLINSAFDTYKKKHRACANAYQKLGNRRRILGEEDLHSDDFKEPDFKMRGKVDVEFERPYLPCKHPCVGVSERYTEDPCCDYMYEEAEGMADDELLRMVDEGRSEGSSSVAEKLVSQSVRNVAGDIGGKGGRGGEGARRGGPGRSVGEGGKKPGAGGKSGDAGKKIAGDGVKGDGSKGGKGVGKDGAGKSPSRNVAEDDVGRPKSIRFGEGSSTATGGKRGGLKKREHDEGREDEDGGGYSSGEDGLFGDWEGDEFEDSGGEGDLPSSIGEDEGRGGAGVDAGVDDGAGQDEFWDGYDAGDGEEDEEGSGKASSDSSAVAERISKAAIQRGASGIGKGGNQESEDGSSVVAQELVAKSIGSLGGVDAGEGVGDGEEQDSGPVGDEDRGDEDFAEGDDERGEDDDGGGLGPGMDDGRRSSKDIGSGKGRDGGEEDESEDLLGPQSLDGSATVVKRRSSLASAGDIEMKRKGSQTERSGGVSRKTSGGSRRGSEKRISGTRLGGIDEEAGEESGREEDEGDDVGEEDFGEGDEGIGGGSPEDRGDVPPLDGRDGVGKTASGKDVGEVEAGEDSIGGKGASGVVAEPEDQRLGKVASEGRVSGAEPRTGRSEVSEGSKGSSEDAANLVAKSINKAVGDLTCPDEEGEEDAGGDDQLVGYGGEEGLGSQAGEEEDRSDRGVPELVDGVGKTVNGKDVGEVASGGDGLRSRHGSGVVAEPEEKGLSKVGSESDGPGGKEGSGPKTGRSEVSEGSKGSSEDADNLVSASIGKAVADLACPEEDEGGDQAKVGTSDEEGQGVGEDIGHGEDPGVGKRPVADVSASSSGTSEEAAELVTACLKNVVESLTCVQEEVDREGGLVWEPVTDEGAGGGGDEEKSAVPGESGEDGEELTYGQDYEADLEDTYPEDAYLEGRMPDEDDEEYSQSAGIPDEDESDVDGEVGVTQRPDDEPSDGASRGPGSVKSITSSTGSSELASKVVTKGLKDAISSAACPDSEEPTVDELFGQEEIGEDIGRVESGSMLSANSSLEAEELVKDAVRNAVKGLECGAPEDADRRGEGDGGSCSTLVEIMAKHIVSSVLPPGSVGSSYFTDMPSGQFSGPVFPLDAGNGDQETSQPANVRESVLRTLSNVQRQLDAIRQELRNYGVIPQDQTGQNQ